ncbi:hypothetical protein OHA74_13315 [Streptomyces phaeochromogenes]|uniref:hypothetical protein n=1 Tax=Streptomyces phaeochromogenes TaxID=1923 RepID=UPI002E2B9744|nr:hypothetical protein [Streptomyces phaeochromogenes]
MLLDDREDLVGLCGGTVPARARSHRIVGFRDQDGQARAVFGDVPVGVSEVEIAFVDDAQEVWLRLSTDRAGTLARMTDPEWEDYRLRLGQRYS